MLGGRVLCPLVYSSPPSPWPLQACTAVRSPATASSPSMPTSHTHACGAAGMGPGRGGPGMPGPGRGGPGPGQRGGIESRQWARGTAAAQGHGGGGQWQSQIPASALLHKTEKRWGAGQCGGVGQCSYQMSRWGAPGYENDCRGSDMGGACWTYVPGLVANSWGAGVRPKLQLPACKCGPG